MKAKSFFVICIFFMGFVLLALIGITSATIYYVRTDGNDVNAGTSNTSGGAWATIQKCADMMVAGDVCRVQGGTYNEQVGITRSGTVVDRITYLGDSKPTVNGLTKGFDISGASYITISGFNITASNYGIYANTGNYLNILNNEVRQTSALGGAGIELANSNYSVIDNNTVIVRLVGIELDRHFENHNNSITNNYIDSSSVDESAINGIDAGRCCSASQGSKPSYYHNVSYNTVVGSGWNAINLGISYSYVGYNIVDGGPSLRISHNAFDLHGMQNSVFEGNIARNGGNYNSGFYVEGYTTPTFNLVFKDNQAINVIGGSAAYWEGNKDSYVYNLNLTVPLYKSQSQGLTIQDYLATGRSYNVTFENLISKDSDFPLSFDSPVRGDYYLINPFINKKPSGYADITFAQTLAAGDPQATVHMINSNSQDVRWYSVTGGTILFYYYLDIKVIDQNGNPVPNAKVSFVNQVDANYPAKNLRVPDDATKAYVPPDSITYTYTHSNGHTSLPSEDRLETVAIPDYKRPSSSTTYYTFNVTAEYGGYTNTTTVNPDSSWYRSDPNTYQNTVTIVLPMSIGNTYYVRMDGNDGNTGTSNTSAGAMENNSEMCKYGATGRYVQGADGNVF